jgi:serine/threonine protein kinase
MTLPSGLRRTSTLLGQGGATQTRLVVDASGAVVGVEKRLVPRLRADALARAQLRTEAQVLRALRGRGAPSLLDSGEDETGAWLLMEHVALASLGELGTHAGVAPGALVTRAARHAFDALVEVHEAADERGPLAIVHGDLSPDNLLVSGDGSAARLVDFGLASFRDAPIVAEEARAAVRGTPLYFAPEVARGEAPTVRSDLFALGLTLLHAASGEPPRGSRTLAPLVVEAAEEPVSSYAERASRTLPAPLRDALRSVVAFDPGERPATAREAWPRT